MILKQSLLEILPSQYSFIKYVGLWQITGITCSHILSKIKLPDSRSNISNLPSLEPCFHKLLTILLLKLPQLCVDLKNLVEVCIVPGTLTYNWIMPNREKDMKQKGRLPVFSSYSRDSWKLQPLLKAHTQCSSDDKNFLPDYLTFFCFFFSGNKRWVMAIQIYKNSQTNTLKMPRLSYYNWVIPIFLCTHTVFSTKKQTDKNRRGKNKSQNLNISSYLKTQETTTTTDLNARTQLCSSGDRIETFSFLWLSFVIFFRNQIMGNGHTNLTQILRQ